MFPTHLQLFRNQAGTRTIVVTERTGNHSSRGHIECSRADASLGARSQERNILAPSSQLSADPRVFLTTRISDNATGQMGGRDEVPALTVSQPAPKLEPQQRDDRAQGDESDGIWVTPSPIKLGHVFEIHSIHAGDKGRRHSNNRHDS